MFVQKELLCMCISLVCPDPREWAWQRNRRPITEAEASWPQLVGMQWTPGLDLENNIGRDVKLLPASILHRMFSLCHYWNAPKKRIVLFICWELLVKAPEFIAASPATIQTSPWWLPLPDSATSAIGTPCSWAMNPSTEKTANPATMLVPLFSKHRYRQSLQNTKTYCEFI